MSNILEIKPHRENIEIIAYYGKKDKKNTFYHNIVGRDPNKIALVLMDLYLNGFPIEDAIVIFLNRISQKDWLT